MSSPETQQTSKQPIQVFVSGCYDILHAGHIQFFNEARALGDHLTVSFASADVLYLHKQRRPSIPDEHKKVLLESLRMVDRVIIGTGHKKGLDFEAEFLAIKPQILCVTTDDKYAAEKKELCERVGNGCRYVVLPKTPPIFTPVSTTSILSTIRAPPELPLRVDFAGGWLDVPKFSVEGAYVVNCAIEPLVSLRDWPYERNSGLGGSAAWAILNGRDGVGAELDLGVGWQDPAIVHETGLCVWKSGHLPKLDMKRNGLDMLRGKMALLYTGVPHDTPSVVDQQRDFTQIIRAGEVARAAVASENLTLLASAVDMSYRVQLDEGMKELPVIKGSLARKYCGGGHGGYALILFGDQRDRDEFVKSGGGKSIEPFMKK